MGEKLKAIAPTKYTKTARALHWTMAVPIIGLLLYGEHTMGNHGARFWPSFHASAGVVIVLLAGFRLYWRKKHHPPTTAHGSAFERMAARLAHAALYAAMVLIPLTGWLAYTEHVRRTLGVQPASWFGYPIPLLPDFAINWHRFHNWGGKLVLALIALHVAAALKHHFWNRDDTLKRMLR